MWSSLKKIFLRDARLSKKWVSRQSPVTLASIEVDNHEKLNKYVIVPQKFFLRDARLSKVGLDSRPVTLASIEVDNHEKNQISMWSSSKKFFSVTLACQKWVSRQSPRDTRLYWSW